MVEIDKLKGEYYFIKRREHMYFGVPRIERAELRAAIKARRWKEKDVEVQEADLAFTF